LLGVEEAQEAVAVAVLVVLERAFQQSYLVVEQPLKAH
jgi:hypothetical protein